MTPDEMMTILRAVQDGGETTPAVAQATGLPPTVAASRLDALHRQSYLHHHWVKGGGTTWQLTYDGLQYLDGSAG